MDRGLAAAENAGATVERIARSPESLSKALLRAAEGASGILLAEPDDLNPDLFARFSQAQGVICKPTESQLATAELGVTDAFAGVARTGSVCVSNTDKLGGAISLFTRRHVAVLDADSIVPRPRDVFTAQCLSGKGMERDFVFITGPSATADMGPVVKGVHGPGKLHIIILER